MSRFFSKSLPRVATGVLVVLIGQTGQTGAARTLNAGPDPAPNWTVALRPGPEGGYLLEAAAGDLRVAKSMKRADQLTVTITDGADTIKLDATQQATTVSVHGRSVTLDVANANEESLKAMRAIIQGSDAARKFQSSVSGELEGGQRKLHPGLTITHALLRALEGDDSAVKNLHHQLLGGAIGPIRAVGFSQGCFNAWEAEVVRAWDDYVACHRELTGIRAALRGMCGWRYALWVESAWFSFLGCSALR